MKSQASSRICAGEGSFRDPSGFVFFYEDQVYRAVDESFKELFDKMSEQDFFKQAVMSGLLVETESLLPSHAHWDAIHEQFPEWPHYLSHRKIETISFPYEWSFCMLADAALHTLKLQKTLLAENLSLKDATAFNIQFEQTQPVFIDITSIEKPSRFDIWIAYGQFCQMFLYPLMLHLCRRVPLRNHFLSSLEGVPVDQVFAQLGRTRSFCFDMLLDVGLPYLLNKKTFSSNDQVLRSKVNVREGSAGSCASQVMNLTRLEKKIEKYKTRIKRRGLWSDYKKIRNYSDEESALKQQEIKTYLETARPKTVLDIGCNTGEFSELAARAGAQVVAVDSDHDCVDHLYLFARENNLSILPLVVDLSNPSPGLGFRNTERAEFLARMKVECVFALAVVHHLMITARIPLSSIRDLFKDLTERMLVVEYIGREDDMFQTLLALREDIYGDFTKASFEFVFEQAFTIKKQTQLSAYRHLYVMEKKNG